MYKPIVKAQEDVKQKIDEKQDEMLEQLKKNQLAITSGLEDFTILQQLPDTPQPQTTKLAIDYKPAMMEKIPKFKSKMDEGFTTDEMQTLMKYNLYPPSDVLLAVKDEKIDWEDYNEKLGKLMKKTGGLKGSLSKNKKMKDKNIDKIDKLTHEIKTMQKYKKHISLIPEGFQTLTGEGIYTQPKRNAYKISSNGQYGGLMIDIPKLLGQLHLIAKKDGNKVLDKKIDFDTLDLLTKRFNSKKNYSDLSKMVFNQLNKLSEIPIHRSSKKYSKIGSGVIYYNDVNDLIDRMELLGGSIYLCIPMYACVCQCTPVYAHVRLCMPMYSRVCPCTPVYAHLRLCMPMYACVCPCTPVYTNVRPCMPMYSRVYPCTPVYAHGLLGMPCTPAYAHVLPCKPICPCVYPCSTVYTHVRLCMPMYSCVCPCTPVYAHVLQCKPICPCVYPCKPVYAHVRLCMLIYSRVCPCTPVYAHALPCMPMYACVSHVLPCMPMYSCICPCTPVYAHVGLCLPMYSRVRPCTSVYAHIRLRMPMYSRVCRCTSVYTHVRLCMPMYSRVCPYTPVYAHLLPCMPMYACVCPCTPVYTHVPLCMPIYSRVFPCTPVYANVLPCMPMYACVCP